MHLHVGRSEPSSLRPDCHRSWRARSARSRRRTSGRAAPSAVRAPAMHTAVVLSGAVTVGRRLEPPPSGDGGGSGNWRFGQRRCSEGGPRNSGSSGNWPSGQRRCGGGGRGGSGGSGNWHLGHLRSIEDNRDGSGGTRPWAAAHGRVPQYRSSARLCGGHPAVTGGRQLGGRETGRVRARRRSRWPRSHGWRRAWGLRWVIEIALHRRNAPV